MPWSDVDPLDCPQYQQLTSITRCLHLHSAMVSFGKQRLFSHKIETRNVKVKAKVLWFAPTKPMSQPNMYGNVSFTLDWSKALEQLGPYLYYIDQKGNADIIYSRVLLTNKYYGNLTPVNGNDSSMPLWKRGGVLHAATVSDGIPHVLEIGIEATAARGKWLYANCKIQPNDHSCANTRMYLRGPYSPCICHRFNYFDKVCPSPYPAYRTKAILNKKCPTMLRDAPSWDQPSVLFEIGSAVELFLKGNDENGDDEDDETVYEDGEYVANYDDHEKTPRQRTSRPGYLYSGSDSESYRSQQSYCSGERSSLGTGASSYRGASGLQQTSASQKEGDEWSTGAKVALVAGGLGLLAGLAAVFASDSTTDEDKKKTKSSREKN